MSPLPGTRPRTRRLLLAATSGAAVVLAAVACTRANPGVDATSSAASSAGPSAASDLPGSCTGVPLKTQLAAAVRGGASLIVAVAAMTGKSVTGNQATAGRPAFYAVTLASVETLRGPAVTPRSAAWIPGPAPGTAATPENSSLLAPGGRLFAIAWPQAATRDPAGPWLQLAPVVGADVVFTPYGCWDLTGLLPGQYQASTPLRPVPSGANFGGTHQRAENGLYTVPLAAVERLAAAA